MQDFLLTMGMVIKAEPIGEYDRRVVILTRDRGKISAFAKGARRPNNKLVAASNPFSFGEFKLYPGRNSYTLLDAEISNYFEELRLDFEGAYYGMYFLEICDYYARENTDEKELLKLLYQSLRALTAKGLNHQLVRCIFEIKSIVVNGEFPGLPTNGRFLETTLYTLNYIQLSTVEKLYTFTVTDEVLDELKRLSKEFCRRCMDHKFKSIEILENLC